MKNTIYVFVCLSIFLISCQTDRTILKSVSFNTEKYSEKTIINTIRNILQNQGYEIKNTGEDYITTEWFQYFSTTNSNPPFDFYIQVRVSLSYNDKKIIVNIKPQIREVNRLNTGAYTESDLYIFKKNEYERQKNQIGSLV